MLWPPYCVHQFGGYIHVSKVAQSLKKEKSLAMAFQHYWRQRVKNMWRVSVQECRTMYDTCVLKKKAYIVFSVSPTNATCYVYWRRLDSGVIIPVALFAFPERRVWRMWPFRLSRRAGGELPTSILSLCVVPRLGEKSSLHFFTTS
jgi:hypothetical protein